MKQKDKVQWFARGGNIVKMGPYASQELAAASLITVAGLPIEGAFVWPETTAQTKRYAELAKKEVERLKTSPVRVLYDYLADECNRRGRKMPRGMSGR